jgi:hypothetical protein
MAYAPFVLAGQAAPYLSPLSLVVLNDAGVFTRARLTASRFEIRHTRRLMLRPVSFSHDDNLSRRPGQQQETGKAISTASSRFLKPIAH